MKLYSAKIFLILSAVASTPIRTEELIKTVTLEDIFTAKDNATTEEISILNKRCKDLNLALEFYADPITNQVASRIQVHDLKIPVSDELLEDVYRNIIKNNPHDEKHDRVRITRRYSPLHQQENEYLAKRDIKCAQSLEGILGEAIDPKHVPRVAFCCSGGGYRAMLCTAGLLKEFDETGLIDSVHYLIGLSGSTWAIATWMLSKKRFSSFHQELLERTIKGFIGNDTKTILSKIKKSLPMLSNYLIQRLIYKETPSVIDIYGYFLAGSIFSKEDHKNYLTTTLSSQIEQIKDANRPFPIYTAIIPHNTGKYQYSWIEFSPYEVSSETLEGGVSNWAYGRHFSRGLSTNNAPELPLGYLMALWGSAISVNFREIYNIVIEKLKPHAIFAPLEKFGKETVFGSIRFFPARHRNYMHGITTAPYHTTSHQTLVDAGIDIMLPIPPVLKEKRAVDVIIICDASPDLQHSSDLRKAENYAKKHGIPFPAIDYSTCWCKTYSIFDDGPNSHAPIVVYIPLIANEDFMPGFNPSEYLDMNEFLNTFNLWYTEEEAKTVSNLMEQAGKELSKPFVDVLKKALDRKRKRTSN